MPPISPFQGAQILTLSAKSMEKTEHFDEDQRAEAEEQSCQAYFKKEKTAECRYRAVRCMEVTDSQCRGNLITDNAGNKRRQQHIVQHGSDEQYLYSEQRAGDRRPEHGGETRADTADDQFLPVPVSEPKQAGEPRGQGRAYLRCRPFLSRRSAESDGNDRSDEFYRHDSQSHFPGMPVHCLDDLFRAVPFRIRRKDLYDQGARK